MNFIDDKSANRIGLNQIKQRLRPLSPYGRHMKQRMPVYLLGCEDQLQREWGLINSLLETWSRTHLEEVELSLNALKDIRAIIRKVGLGYVLEDVELFEVKRFLEASAKVKQSLCKMEWTPVRLMPPDIPQLSRALNQGNSPGFYLAGSFAPGLAACREAQRQLKAALSRLQGESQEEISSKTGKGFNHQGRMRISKLEEELIQKLAHCPQLVFAAETYTEIEYILRETPEMSELSQQIHALEDKIQGLEHRARAELSQEVAAHRSRLLAACRRLGRLDLVIAKARLARETAGCVPETVPDACLYLRDFVNPVVEQYLSKQGLSFQPLSLNLGETPVTAITGANMGGKSVALKSAGLAVAMAQLGLLVPAKECKFSLRSFIFYSQQDEDLQQGLSTFGAEISALAQVLPHRNQLGLYLLDEPARGTNPWEGNALVQAIAKWLAKGKSITLIATHFPGLSELADITKLRVAGLTIKDGPNPPGLTIKDGPNPPGLTIKDGPNPPFQHGLEQINKLMNYALVPSTGEVPQDALRIAAYLGLEQEILATAAQQLGLPPKRS